MNSNKNWELKIDNCVYKELSKFSIKDSRRMVGVIELFPLDPYAGDIQKIKGEKDVWRRRVGNYRIFYEIDQNAKTIHIFRVERRGSKTY